MTEDYQLFRYALRYDFSVAGAPSFQDSCRFVYDRAELGRETLPKLAKEAVRKREAQHMQGPRAMRVWVWRDNGELVGSVEVKVQYEPRILVDDRTIDRGLPA